MTCTLRGDTGSRRRESCFNNVPVLACNQRSRPTRIVSHADEFRREASVKQLGNFEAARLFAARVTAFEMLHLQVDNARSFARQLLFVGFARYQSSHCNKNFQCLS